MEDFRGQKILGLVSIVVAIIGHATYSDDESV